MSTVQLTCAQQKRMKKLTARVDIMSQADRRFFERFPRRQHRIRMASQAEIEQHELLTGEMPWLPGTRIFVAVRNIVAGARMRLYFRGLDGADTDLDECMARAIFEASAGPQTWKIEAQLREAVEAR